MLRKYFGCMLLCVLLLYLQINTANSSPIKDNVWFVFSDHETPPDTTADWRPVIIPDSWNKTQNRRGGNGWYRIRRHLDVAPTEVWALLLERVNMNAAAFVGQHFLGDGGSFEEPVSRNWARPLLFSIQPKLLHAGDNDIYVRVFSYAQHAGGLQIYHLGLRSVLQKKYQSAYDYYITLSQVVAGVQLLLALLLLMLWLGRKGDAEYLWLSAATLVSIMFSVNIFIQNLPVAQWLWLWLAQVSLGWFSWFMMMFAHRYFDVHKPMFEKWVSWFAVVGAIMLLLLPDVVLIVSLVVWHLLFGLLNVYVLWLSVNQWWHKRDMYRLGWMGAYILLFASFMHDRILIVVHQGFHFQMMFHLGVFVFIVFVFIMLGSRFVQALNMTEQNNLELLGKIDRFKAQEAQEKAVVDERKRIMRDLHDGLGNSLVSAMALSRDSQKNQPALQDVLQEAMSEMRLIVGSASNLEFNFEKALTLIKERTKLMLYTSNIACDWQAEAMLKAAWLNDSVVAMHVIRILQEALTNAIKHANASEIRVVATLDDNTLKLCISDDGQGIVDDKHGHGLNNMKSRAESIHATLSIHSDTSGTTTTLLLPLAEYLANSK